MTTAAVTEPPRTPGLRSLDAAQWLALGAVAGPALFTAAWIVLGFVSPGYTMWDLHIEQYSAVSQPISGLGLGATAAYMNTAFVVSGILIMVGAVGIFRSVTQMRASARGTCAALLALHGVGAILDGIFTLESILLHTAGFMLALSPILTFLVISHHLRRIPQWRRFGTWLLIASPLTLILAMWYFATFDPQAAANGIGIGGLTQRLLLVELQAWIAVMGWLAIRRSQNAAPPTVAAQTPRQ